MGITSKEEIKLGIIPLKFENFAFDYDKKRVKFDKISILDSPIQILSNTAAITGGSLYNKIESNLEQVFPRTFNEDTVITGDILTKVNDFSRTVFKIKQRSKNMSKDQNINNIAENNKKSIGRISLESNSNKK